MEPHARLKTLREERNLNVKDIAEILGTTVKRVTSWENGERTMPTRYYVMLAEHYNLSLDYIVGLTDEPKIKRL